jgi:hypothetical protein
MKRRRRCAFQREGCLCVCAQRAVVTDTNVLTNLIHVDALGLLGGLSGFEFVVVDDVVQEITRPEQAHALSAAMTHGWVMRRVSLDKPEGIALFAELALRKFT